MNNVLESNGFMGRLQPSATLALTSKAKSLKAQGKDVCSLSAGEPDFDTPENIKKVAIDAIEKGLNKYTPATGIPKLKEVIAEKFIKENGIQTSPANIVVAPGAKFSVFSVIAALCGPGDEVIIVSPYWVSYPSMIEATGATVKVISTKAENNFELSPEELKSTINENTKLLILNSPSNPTGAVYRKETLEKIADIAVKTGIMILADEIYEKLVYDSEKPHISIASLSPEIAERTITVNGLSKAYAMTGWRLGYLTAPEFVVKRISALQSHTTSNPTSFVQYAAIEAIAGPQEEVEKMREQFAKRRDLIYNLLSEISGMECIKPSGAFYVFCDISKFGISSNEFCQRLLDEKLVAAIPGEPFGIPQHIRLSYACSEAVIKEAASRIAEFCSELT
jgi:aspartate aminotransferase